MSGSACFAGMSGYFYQYITVVVRDFIFFHNDVQSTTIAVAIASSLCCSIVWAICHLLTLGSSSASCKSSKDKRPATRTSNFAWGKPKRRKSPTNVRLIGLLLILICARIFPSNCNTRIQVYLKSFIFFTCSVFLNYEVFRRLRSFNVLF